ncbi:MAG: hypothetical protein IIA41_05755 [SAR324 cluster bacterium]|nr:hypothetical protein [SAR324 cluster bacterium]
MKLPPFHRLKSLLGDLRRPDGYRDTLRRLLQEGFADLTPEQRRAKAEQIVELCASAAMVAGAAPVPLLELPLQAIMVGAVAKVHGVPGGDRKLLLQVAAALGGGLVIRQALRLIPVVGGISQMSRIYATTWALGQVANLYCERSAAHEPVPDRETLRQAFADTLERKERERTERMESAGISEKLNELNELREQGRISEEEYERRRQDLLAVV